MNSGLVPRRILVVQASTATLQGPNVNEEFRRISQSVAGAPYGHALSLECLQAARAADLPDRLARHGVPAVLHFSGRGTADGGGLRFLTEDGRDDMPITNSGLQKLIAEVADEGLELVVLNACWTDDLAGALAESAGCVIGTCGPIPDISALDYARELYRNIACGHSVGRAHRLACAATAMYGAAPADLPTLRNEPEVNADGVFLVGPEYRTPLPGEPVKPTGSGIRYRLGKGKGVFRRPG